MPLRSLTSRLEALEERQPLHRAYELLARGTPPEQWPDAELNAYCDTLPPIYRQITDAELEALVDAPTERARAALLAQYAGRYEVPL